MINALGLLKRAPLPAPVRHPVPGRVQRQSVQDGDGAVRDLRDLQRCRGRSRGSTRWRPACSPCPSSCSPRSPGQLADTHDKARIIRHRQDRRDLHHAGRRGAGWCSRRSGIRTVDRLMLGRGVRCWACTRPSSARSNTRSCRSIWTRTTCSAAPGLVEAGTYIAILIGTILAGLHLAARRRRSAC